jgi:hypothetical protein
VGIAGSADSAEPTGGTGPEAATDPCVSGPCDPHAICLSNPPGYQCLCPLPWYGDGSRCQRDDDQNWGFETWTATASPPGFLISPPDNVAIAEATGTAAEGERAASVTWTTVDNRDLVAGDYLPAVPGQTYTAHWWVYDADPQGRVRPWLGFYGPDFVQTSTHYAGTYSKDASGWREYTDSTVAPATGASWVRSGLRLYDVNDSARGAVFVDAFDLTQPVEFQPTDGVLDDLPGKPDAPPGVPGGPADLRVALSDRGLLYVALLGVDTSVDRRVAVWLAPPDESATVAAPWSDPMVLPAPRDQGLLGVLTYRAADRACTWLVSSPGVDFQSAPGSACSGATGTLLEGTIDLVATAGLDGPANLPATCGFWVASPGAVSPLVSDIVLASRARLLVGRVVTEP